LIEHGAREKEVAAGTIESSSEHVRGHVGDGADGRAGPGLRRRVSGLADVRFGPARGSRLAGGVREGVLARAKIEILDGALGDEKLLRLMSRGGIAFWAA